MDDQKKHKQVCCRLSKKPAFWLLNKHDDVWVKGSTNPGLVTESACTLIGFSSDEDRTAHIEKNQIRIHEEEQDVIDGEL